MFNGEENIFYPEPQCPNPSKWGTEPFPGNQWGAGCTILLCFVWTDQVRAFPGHFLRRLAYCPVSSLPGFIFGYLYLCFSQRIDVFHKILHAAAQQIMIVFTLRDHTLLIFVCFLVVLYYVEHWAIRELPKPQQQLIQHKIILHFLSKKHFFQRDFIIIQCCGLNSNYWNCLKLYTVLPPTPLSGEIQI